MLKKWFRACRPWSLTASFIPVTLGTALAWNQGVMHWGLFLLALGGGMAIQVGTNLINTYGDYVSGVDSEASSRNVPDLVQHIFQPAQIKRAGLIAFAIAALLGGWLIWLRGWPLLVLGALGVLGGYTYTAGPLPYKYKGLGSILVFFLMGPMMVWGAYYVQTGSHNWAGVLASIPVGFLVSAILHANDMRDMEYDRGAGISTFALLLGRRSLAHYFVLNLGAFVALLALVAGRVLPWPALLPCLLVPRVIALLRDARRGWAGDRPKLEVLEPASGAFHFQFGLLLVVGLALFPLF